MVISAFWTWVFSSCHICFKPSKLDNRGRGAGGGWPLEQQWSLKPPRKNLQTQKNGSFPSFQGAKHSPKNRTRYLRHGLQRTYGIPGENAFLFSKDWLCWKCTFEINFPKFQDRVWRNSSHYWIPVWGPFTWLGATTASLVTEAQVML